MFEKLIRHVETRGIPSVILEALQFLALVMAIIGFRLSRDLLLVGSLGMFAIVMFLLWVVTRRDRDRIANDNKALNLALATLRETYYAANQKTLTQTIWRDHLRVDGQGNCHQTITKTFVIHDDPIHFIYIKVGGPTLTKKEKKALEVSATLDDARSLVCQVDSWTMYDKDNELATAWAYLPHPVSNEELTITFTYMWPRAMQGLTRRGQGSEGFAWVTETKIPEEGMQLSFSLTLENSVGIHAPLKFTPSQFRSTPTQNPVNGNWQIDISENVKPGTGRLGFRLTRNPN